MAGAAGGSVDGDASGTIGNHPAGAPKLPRWAHHPPRDEVVADRVLPVAVVAVAHDVPAPVEVYRTCDVVRAASLRARALALAKGQPPHVPWIIHTW